MPRTTKLVITWSVLVVGTVFLLGIFLWWLFSPANPSDISLRHITVPKGASIASITDQLEEQGIIKSSLILRIMLRGKNAVATIQTGSYELSPAMRIDQIADELLVGSKDIWVTLIEGWRVEEITDELTREFSLRFFDPAVFLASAKPSEGMLFPDTYLFPKQASANMVLNTLKDTFEKKYQQAASEAGQPKLSKTETVILASLIEREAKDPKDKKIVAGILMNRLASNIPLQVDATLQYVKGYDSAAKTWWPQPKAADKGLKSLFNTYLNRGLPPSPICNPGLEALKAAMAPTSSNYLYYLTDTQGKMHYAHTLEEHNVNVEKYLR